MLFWLFLSVPRRFAPLAFLAALLLAVSFPRLALAELRAEDLALVINRNVPQSRIIADYYVKARGLPTGRIIELDLPYKEECTYDEYERKVVPVIREFLRANHLEQQVKCLVTIYGVPIRVAARADTPANLAESTYLGKHLDDLLNVTATLVGEGEDLARAHDASFQSGPDQTWDALRARAEHAGNSLGNSIQKIADVQAKADAFSTAVAWRQKFTSPIPATEPPEMSAGLSPEQAVIRQASLQVVDEMRDSAPARARLRELVRQQVGLFGYAGLLRNQIAYLAPGTTTAAFDSELALLWWPYYPRAQWQANFFNWRYPTTPPIPTVMTMRLDGPEPQMVKDLIATGIAVEKKGLQGRVAIDSRGIALTKPDGAVDGYGEYDQKLRNLAALLKAHSKIGVTLDERPELFQQRAVRNVAVYVGWYSVGNYIPGMGFVPGAVGYHVASFEMVSLRDPTNKGWVKHLIRDGVVGTLGAVEEPFLGAFPPADEFFPLLLTGKLTLAEVYWKTAPMTSWMINMIGDPLYTPYRVNPQFEIDDLPEPLKGRIIGPLAATRPLPSTTTGPTTTMPSRR